MLNLNTESENRDPKTYRWYALHARSHFEQKVYDGLVNKSIEAFLPRIQVISRRQDRHKKILVPMLPGYVFVRTNMQPDEYYPIIKTAGVVRIVGFMGRPVPADEQEITSLMILDKTDRTVHNRSLMKRGDLVMIMQGPLKGLVGYYLRHKGQSDKVFVSVELLNRSLAVEIDDWALNRTG